MLYQKMEIHEKLNELYSSKSFRRRVKKHVKAKLLNIDIIVTPQWKHLCQKEVLSLGYEYQHIGTSVLRVRGKIGDLYKLALWLRTASRVCVSLPSFRMETVRKLKREIGKIPWDMWVNPLIPLHFYTNVEYSKLRHEGLVERTVIDEMAGYFSDLGFDIALSGKDFDEKKELHCPRQRIWINVFKDVCEIRLDMVGANLHQRGYRMFPGYAPLRETLAAAILELAGWDGKSNLIDGMTGSGTFAIEATLKAKNIPPGYFRNFMFEKLPSFQEKTWNYQKKLAQKGVIDALQTKIVAVDKDPDTVEFAKRNADVAGVREEITWVVQDFFNIFPAQLNVSPGLLVLNPPYGKRLKTSTRALYKKIVSHLIKNFVRWRFAIIVPHSSLLSCFNDMKYSVFHLPHGGLWINVVVGEIA